MAAGIDMPAEIWSLTLEIIQLLTEETYPDAQPGDHVTISVTPPPSLSPDRHALQKILEVTRKITELLIGEMESPLELYLEVKEENDEEPVTREAGSSGVGGDLWSGVKMEASGVTQVRSPLGEYGAGSASEEAKSCKEEEHILIIGADGQSSWNKTEEHAAILSQCEKDDITAQSMGSPTAMKLHPASLVPDLCSYLSTHSACHNVYPPLHIADISKKLYSCSECGKCFPLKSDLIRHESVHSGEKPYSCSICGKCFPQKSALISHERVHTGEKPFSCSVCGKCFSQKAALISHERVHTGEKPYSCTECGKCFSQKINLISHEIVHTGEKPYSCSECGKCFSHRSALIRHEKVHTGVKPFACLECGKCFSDKGDLNKHGRVHTGVKPYSCSECGKHFTDKSSLRRHGKLHP